MQMRKTSILVLFLLREGLCLMLIAAGRARHLFTRQLKKAICRFWSFLWLGARTCMLKTSECCLMSATTLRLVAAMLLTAAIEIAVACSVWLMVDDESADAGCLMVL